MSVIDSRVINIDELKLEHFAKGDKFETRGVRIGPLLGAKDLGYSYDVVPPGKRSRSMHARCVRRALPICSRRIHWSSRS